MSNKRNDLVDKFIEEAKNSKPLSMQKALEISGVTAVTRAERKKRYENALIKSLAIR